MACKPSDNSLSKVFTFFANLYCKRYLTYCWSKLYDSPMVPRRSSGVWWLKFNRLVWRSYPPRQHKFICLKKENRIEFINRRLRQAWRGIPKETSIFFKWPYTSLNYCMNPSQQWNNLMSNLTFFEFGWIPTHQKYPWLYIYIYIYIYISVYQKYFPFLKTSTINHI